MENKGLIVHRVSITYTNTITYLPHETWICHYIGHDARDILTRTHSSKSFVLSPTPVQDFDAKNRNDVVSTKIFMQELAAPLADHSKQSLAIFQEQLVEPQSCLWLVDSLYNIKIEQLIGYLC